MGNLFDIFPVPRILFFDFVGLQISDGTIRVIRLEKYGDEFLPIFFDEIEVDTSYFEDENNKNNKRREKIVQALVELRENYDLTEVRFAIPEQKTYTYTASLMIESDQRVRDAIELTLEDNLPFKADEISFDFEIISHDKESGSAFVAVVATPNEVVNDYAEVISDAGLIPVRAMSSSHAVNNSIVYSNSFDPHVLLNLDEDKVEVSVVDDGIVQLTSTVKFQGEIKEFSDKSKRAKAMRKEIGKILLYWYSNHPQEVQERVHKILIVGNSQKLNAFASYIRENFESSEVLLGDVWRNCFSTDSFIPPISLKESYKYAVAIGAAIPQSCK